MTAPGFLCALLLAACTGNIANPSGAGGSAQSGTGGTTTNCSAHQAAALPARLLSPSQYNNTVNDLLQVSGDASMEFGGGADVKLDDVGIELRADAAAKIAHQAAATLSVWSPCDPSTAAACSTQLIERVGSRGFRHPLSTGEKAQLQKLFDAGLAAKDFTTGVEWLLTGLLQSPDFLYQLSKPLPTEKAGEVVPLAGHELATRISYFLWDSMPDDQLMAAAKDNRLANETGVRAELDRMMHDPRFERGLKAFYSTWLRTEGFGELARDDIGFNGEVVGALEQSLMMSVTELYKTASPTLANLFTGHTYYLNGALRAFYGLPAGDAGFTATEMSAEERHGIVTHPALMALLARPKESNPISRGLFFRRTLMCQDIPPPPAGVIIPQLPPIAPGLSTRDRLDQHSEAKLCAGCHDLIDPPGFALEGFDEVGRHRTTDSGKAVNTSGTMKGAGDLDGPFSKGEELLQKMPQSNDLKVCFAQTYLTYALARPIQAADACAVDALAKQFAKTGTLKDLAASIAHSDAFRLRLAEGIAQ